MGRIGSAIISFFNIPRSLLKKYRDEKKRRMKIMYMIGELERIQGTGTASLYLVRKNPDFGKLLSDKEIGELKEKEYQNNLKFFTEHPYEFLAWNLNSPDEIERHSKNCANRLVDDIMRGWKCPYTITEERFTSITELCAAECSDGFVKWTAPMLYISYVKRILGGEKIDFLTKIVLEDLYRCISEINVQK